MNADTPAPITVLCLLGVVVAMWGLIGVVVGAVGLAFESDPWRDVCVAGVATLVAGVGATFGAWWLDRRYQRNRWPVER